MGEVKLLALDPGPVRSGFVLYQDGHVQDTGHVDNADILGKLRLAKWGDHFLERAELVLESVDHYGMAVGRDVFETVFWAGRFAQAFEPSPWFRVSRSQVKLHLCASPRATDANVRQALIDRYGGDRVALGGIKCSNCRGQGWRGRGRVVCDPCSGSGYEVPPGPLAKVKTHAWAALAVAVTFAETKRPAQSAGLGVAG